MRSTFTSAFRAALPIAALLASVSSQAGYTIIDDDLYPSQISNASARAIDTDEFKITFIKGSSSLNPMARSYLVEMLPRMRNASQIRIVGRMDSASTNENKKNRQVGTARASAIRSYLISQGISPRVLEVEVEADGNPDASRGYSTSDVVVSNPRPVISSSEARTIPRHYKNLGNETVNAPVASPTPSRTTDAEGMLRYINQAVQSGQMEPSVAVKLLRSVMEADSTNPPQQPLRQANAAPIEKPIPVTSEVKAPTIGVTTWEILQADETLQNTLARWGTAANWEVHWNDVPEIKNPGYIKLPDRDFFSAAEYVLSKAKLAAKAAGIDISIKAYSNRVLVISKEVQK